MGKTIYTEDLARFCACFGLKFEDLVGIFGE